MLVSSILTEITNEIVTDLTSDQMLYYFKSALRMIPSFATDRAFLNEISFTLPSGSSTYDLSSLSQKITRERDVWYLDDNSHRIKISKPSSIEFFNSLVESSQSGKPSYYKIYQETIRFDKLADASITIGMDTFVEISDVTASSTFYGSENVIELAKMVTKAEYYEQYEEDEAKADRYMLRAVKLGSKLDEEYTEQEYGGEVEEEEVY